MTVEFVEAKSEEKTRVSIPDLQEYLTKLDTAYASLLARRPVLSTQTYVQHPDSTIAEELRTAMLFLLIFVAIVLGFLFAILAIFFGVSWLKVIGIYLLPGLLGLGIWYIKN